MENQELRFHISKKTIKYVLKRENLKIVFFPTILLRVQYYHAIIKNLKISFSFLLSFYLPNHCDRGGNIFCCNRFGLLWSSMVSAKLFLCHNAYYFSINQCCGRVFVVYLQIFFLSYHPLISTPLWWGLYCVSQSHLRLGLFMQ